MKMSQSRYLPSVIVALVDWSRNHVRNLNCCNYGTCYPVQGVMVVDKSIAIVMYQKHQIQLRLSKSPPSPQHSFRIPYTQMNYVTTRRLNSVVKIFIQGCFKEIWVPHQIFSVLTFLPISQNKFGCLDIRTKSPSLKSIFSSY